MKTYKPRKPKAPRAARVWAVFNGATGELERVSILKPKVNRDAEESGYCGIQECCNLVQVRLVPIGKKP